MGTDCQTLVKRINFIDFGGQEFHLYWYDTKKWDLCVLRYDIQISMEAILACHPARSTEWLDWVVKSCELWRSRTGPIQLIRHVQCEITSVSAEIDINFKLSWSIRNYSLPKFERNKSLWNCSRSYPDDCHWRGMPMGRCLYPQRASQYCCSIFLLDETWPLYNSNRMSLVFGETRESTLWIISNACFKMTTLVSVTALQ